MSWDGFISEKLKSRNYNNRNETKKDILSALKYYSDLTPREDTYVSEPGKQTLLLNLNGTIPVNYKGSIYNIPIQIWLQQTHPHNGPVVYVRPTSAMVIRPSRHVDESGRVYLPFLSDWNSKFQMNKHNLLNLMQQLRDIFGQLPPVFAKSAPQIPRPLRPYSSPYPLNNPSNHPVPHGGMPMPGPSPGYPQSSMHAATHHQASSYPHNPPYPTQQPSASYSAASSAGPTPYTSGGNVTPYPAASTEAPYPTMSSYQQSQSSSLARQGSILDPKTVRLSLLSTAEDKLKHRIREVFEMGRIEQETLQITKAELESGNKTLKDMISKMKDDQTVLESNISQLEQKNEELEDTLKKLESDSEKMNIDEAVVTTAPLYTQILNLFAEESAIEDALYYLNEGLRREVVELDVFLKNVRTMSRRQFMLRATLLKARETAGLC